MYKDQITVLLGHNGAGKTTTMSILTGLFPPTSGSALINGLSVVDDIDIIRRNLGICPQYNVLFDRLTVSEHLHFFAKLKGARSSDIDFEVNALIDDLSLKDKGKVKSMNLSGGMKRKLSVAIALVCGSEVVILDEPTSGMDPYARRATWDLLDKHKKGRTIVLTTHFMDEADLLGDRIAIMSEGRLRCSGSSFFLKSRYGDGYHLTMVKASNCNSDMVALLVRDSVTGAEQVTDVGAELSFLLPAQSTQQFPDLLDTLDSRKKQLGINSFGISVTTMEEVFIRVSSGTDDILLGTRKSVLPAAVGMKENSKSFHHSLENETDPVVSTSVDADKVTSTCSPPPVPFTNDDIPILGDKTEITIQENDSCAPFKSPRNHGFRLWCQQFFAMFLKRFYNSLRFWIAIIWQLIIPLLFVLWALILGITNIGFNSDDPSRVLTIENSALSDNRTFFYAQFTEMSLFSSKDIETLGLTRYFDITDDVHSIVNNTGNVNDTDICCNYQYQILDKYCASRTIAQIMNGGSVCSSNESFGYNPCPECLQ